MNINKRVVAAVAAVVLAVLGIVALVSYTNDANDRAFKGTKLTTVIRVVEDVPAGTKGSALRGAVESVKLPVAAVPDTALTSLDQVSGLVTTTTLVPGEILVPTRFGDGVASAGDGKGGTKDVAVPAGLQEITITVTPVRAVGGTVKAGDTVGILASYDQVFETNFAVNKVLVLGVESVPAVTADASGTAGNNVRLRLAVASLDAEKIVHAAEFGHIYLSLQNDKTETGRQRVTTDGVLK